MKAKFYWIAILIIGVLLLDGCSSRVRVGELRSDSQSVELGEAKEVRVEIDFGAGSLDLSGGAEKLLESDFTYNVEKLKPVVKYAGNKLVVRQPGNQGMSDIRRIWEFRNEWDLNLYNDVPMDLSVNVGGGSSNLQLGGLSLTRLKINQGAGTGTVDLTGDWQRDLDVTIDAGATHLTVLLPSNVGVRIVVDRGPTIIDAPGLTRNGNVYTNDAYGLKDVTVQVDLTTGIGFVNLEVMDAAAAQDSASTR